MNEQQLIKYIKGQKWFFGVRRVVDPFYFSIKLRGEKKLMLKDWKIKFIERLIIPLEKNVPVVVINHNQATFFHGHSLRKVVKNCNLLEKYIIHEQKNWHDIYGLGKKLEGACKRQDLGLAKNLFRQIVTKLEKHGFYLFVIFSMGMVLTVHVDNFGASDKQKKVLKRHDIWRNKVVYSEERVKKMINKYLRLVGREIKVPAKDIVKHLTIDELEKCLEKELDQKALQKMIKTRKKSGLVFMGLRQGFYVIDQTANKQQVRKHFVKLQKEGIKKIMSTKSVQGNVAFHSDKKIKGRVKICLPEEKITSSLQDRVLVTSQTTPDFIKYLKGVKAIITDEGGVTCHAAITARELKIPCIIGTKVATKALKDGQFVEVDANKGVIKIIKK